MLWYIILIKNGAYAPFFLIMRKYFYLLFVVVIYSSNTRAEIQLSITPSLLFFDYTEFSLNDNVLNNESGAIPGIQLLLNNAINDQLSIELEISRYAGDVDYNGYTQSGSLINTTTNEDILRYSVRIITPLLNNTDIFISTSSHQWERDIQGKAGILGIFEKYQWQEISAGIKTNFLINKQSSWFVEVAILKTIEPEMYINLSEADLGSTNLKLGTDIGARFQLSWVEINTDKLSYGINAFYEAWNFGISDSKTTSGGSSSISVFEPRSETRHSGIQFQLKLHH